jgi:signal transduction histidine kinase
MTLPIRARLTLWYTGLTMTVLAAAAIVIVLVQGQLGRSGLDSELSRVAATVESVMRHEFAEGMALPAAAAETSSEVVVSGVSVILSHPGGGVIVAWGETLPEPWVPVGPVPAEVLLGGTRYRTQVRQVTGIDAPFHVTVLGSLAPLARQQRELRQAVAAGLLAAFLVAAAGGWFGGRRALRPLTRMAEEASGLSTREGAIRLHVPHPDDELGRLGRAFNALLERLSGALQRQRQFMADASHQMRTPVSVLRTTAQVTLRKPSREEREYRESLTIVGEQAARLARLVDAMFLLARAEAGGLPLRREALYLDELVDECARAVAVLAAERDVSVRTAGDTDLPFSGDDELLRHMVVNVLENAVRHTPGGGEVRAELTRLGDAVVLRVRDQGEGVSPADRERIFDRFVSLDGRPGGAGLGLPMARWIAERHGGSLGLESTGPDGSCFLITLPLTGVESPAPASPAAVS